MYVENEKPELRDLYDYVAVTYGSKWKLLGRILNIREDLLRNIENDYPQDCEECCGRMLNDWLELTPDATWQTLLHAIDRVQSTPEGMYVKLIYMYFT